MMETVAAEFIDVAGIPVVVWSNPKIMLRKPIVLPFIRALGALPYCLMITRYGLGKARHIGLENESAPCASPPSALRMIRKDESQMATA